MSSMMPQFIDLNEKTDFAASVARFKARIPADAQWGEPIHAGAAMQQIAPGVIAVLPVIYRELPYKNGKVRLATCNDNEVGFGFEYNGIVPPGMTEKFTKFEHFYAIDGGMSFETGLLCNECSEPHYPQMVDLSDVQYKMGIRPIAGLFSSEFEMEAVVPGSKAFTDNRFDLLENGATYVDLAYEPALAQIMPSVM